ncbi:MAG: transketolase, partial [Clostridia bacterium]|nr:transketolase [Clostridia bacterium]
SSQVKRIAVEAATSFGWHKYTGLSGKVIALDTFGESAPADLIFKKKGFTIQNVVETVKEILV